MFPAFVSSTCCTVDVIFALAFIHAKTKYGSSFLSFPVFLPYLKNQGRLYDI